MKIKKIFPINLISSAFMVAYFTFLLSGILKFLNSADKSHFELFIESKTASNFILLTTLALVFKKRLSAKLLIFTSTGAFVLANTFFFEEPLFELLVQGQFINDSTNTQWPRVFFAFFCASSLLLLIFKKFRTLDLTFFSISSWVVITTTLIFHQVTGSGALIKIENEKREKYQNLLKQPTPSFIKKCKSLKAYCMIHNEVINPQINKKLIIDELDSLAPKLLALRNKDFIRIKDEEYHSMIFRGITSEGSKKTRVAIIDIWDYHKEKMIQVNYFYFLSLCAHFSWSLIAVGLSLLHNKKRLVILRRFFLSS